MKVNGDNTVEVNKLARRWIDKEGTPFKDLGRNAYFGFLYEDGGMSPIEGGACHASVLNHGRHTKQYEDKSVVAIVSRILRDQQTEFTQSENSIRFYDWLFNRSPFQQVFLTKDSDACMKEGWCVVDCNNPANMVQAGLIATRNTWEFPSNIDRWASFVDKGVKEDLAFLIVHFLSIFDVNEVALTTRPNGHAVIGSSLSLKGARAFINHKPMNLKPNYSEGTDAHGVFALWDSDSGDNGFLKHLREELKKFLEGSKKTVCLNPFQKAKKSASADDRVITTNDKLAEFLVKHESNILGEVND